MTLPDPDTELAREIFQKVNQSYMTFNKNSKHGINHNTQLLIEGLIAQALREARRQEDEKEEEK